MTDVTLQLPAEIVDAIAELVFERVRQELDVEQRSNGHGPRWLYGAKAAADYLSMPLGRVQKLTAAGKIPHHRLDGEQRVSYRTDELDACLDDHYEGPPHLRAVG
jgi:excisionase family DNA binding protein